MNFYKDSPFSHSLKVLNELSISCSNKNIIYKVCGNCLITKESFLSFRNHCHSFIAANIIIVAVYQLQL